MVQDKRGVMWIGTSTGLIKFYSNSFEPIPLSGLKNSEILQLKIDKEDNLWFMNLTNQLCKYSIPLNKLEIMDLPVKATMNTFWLSPQLIGAYSSIKDGILINSRGELIREDFQLKSINSDDMIIKQLRSDKPFEYEISIDPLVVQKEFYLSPMLIQPYIENAIQHGLSGIENGFLSISIKRGIADSILISIQDNGPGIKLSLQSKTNNNHISMGSKKNNDRINLLQDIYKKTFSFKITDLAFSTIKNQGMNVSLEISNISKQVRG